MKTINIALNGSSNLDIEYNKEQLYIAVDGGYEFFKRNDITADVLIGDLDSIQSDILDNIEIIKFPEKKDETDFVLTLEYIKNRYGSDNKINIYNYKAMSRIEHFINNLKLLTPNMTMIDEYSIISFLKPGKYEVEKKFEYISLVINEDVEDLTIKGCEYQITNRKVNENETYLVSNKFQDTKCYISFKAGSLFLIQSKGD